jgi:hypothetical protein
MIIKTEELEKQLEENLWQITPDKNEPLIVKGSYKFRPYNSLITDIDYTAKVRYNENLRTIAILTMLKRIKKNRFIFMDFSCGVYKDFILPWTIEGTGCDFDYNKTIEWYNQLKQKNILSTETQQFIENRLLKDTLTIKELIEIEKELESYYDIKWSENDLINGYKIDIYDNVTKYNFLETLKNNIGVLKFLFIVYYQNTIDYIPIDLRLIDYNIEEKGTVNPYYTEDWYRIFKGYKWKIQEKYKPEYLDSFLKIDYQNSLLNRLKMLKKIIKYKVLSKKDFDILELKILEEIKNPLSTISEQQRNTLNLSQLISLLSKNISKAVENDVQYFRNKIDTKDIIKQDMYFNRALIYANTPISINELQQRTLKGIKCPFFEIDNKEYDYLYKMANDFLINPINLINCFIQIANQYNLLIKDMINIQEQPKIFLKINTENTNIIDIFKRDYNKYYNRRRKIDVTKISENKIIDFNKSFLNHIQQYLVKTLFKY